MEYKKPQPLLTLSFFLIIGAVAIGYYLDAPLYKKMQTQQTQINNLSSTNNLRIQYENKIREIDQKLKENNWEAKKEIIKGSFESSPFYLSKVEIFFKDIVLKNGLSFGNISISAPSSVKTASSQQTTQQTGASKTTNFKPQEETKPVAEATGSLASIQGPVNKLDFTLTVSGSYDFFKMFLESMERQAFLISIKKIGFSAPGSDGKMTFTIDGEIYSY